MRSSRFIPLLAAVLFSAIAATLLLTVLTLIQIEEPWNIVVVSQTLALTRHTFIVVLAHAFVLGSPLFLLLRSMGYIGVVSCALGGFLVGAGPVGVLLLISMLGLNSASTGGVPTVINGVPTLAGWIEYAHAVAFAGSFGMAGGLAFWITLRLSAQAAEAPNELPAQSSKWHARSWGISLATGLLTCTILTAGSGWQPLARNLLEKIESRWPQRTTFHGPNGKAISIQQALRGRQ